MIELLLEGFDSALLPCPLILLAPGAAIALAGRRYGALGLGAYALAVIVVGWLRFSGRSATAPALVIAALLVIGLAALLLQWRVDRTHGGLVGAAGFFTGAAAASLWGPCVGEAFGDLLGDLPGVGAVGLVRFAIYSVGVLSPLIILGSVLYLLPDSGEGRIWRGFQLLGIVVVALLSLATVVGWQDDLVSQLVRWSV